MKVSYSWLKDYVDVKLDPVKLAGLLTMAGVSVTSCKKISGDYDWHGLSLAGHIHGERNKDLIHFSWDWTRSSEKGRGIFWLDVPDVLYGGWWMDYQDISDEDIESKRVEPPNRWEFVNVTGLHITTPDHDYHEKDREIEAE